VRLSINIEPEAESFPIPQYGAPIKGLKQVFKRGRLNCVSGIGHSVDSGACYRFAAFSL
jgi:hypothetical protein